MPFEVPGPDEFPQRLAAVLSVSYPIFNEGYGPSSGQRWIRDELCAEALRLAPVLAALVPDQPDVHALMEFPVLLEDQDRTKWDRHRDAAAEFDRAREVDGSMKR